MSVVNAKATPQVDDLDMHEVLVVSCHHLQQYQGRSCFHLFDVTMQGGKDRDVHDGAAQVDVDTHYHNPAQHGLVAVKLAQPGGHQMTNHRLNDEVSNTWGSVSGLLTLLGGHTHLPRD